MTLQVCMITLSLKRISLPAPYTRISRTDSKIGLVIFNHYNPLSYLRRNQANFGLAYCFGAYFSGMCRQRSNPAVNLNTY